VFVVFILSVAGLLCHYLSHVIGWKYSSQKSPVMCRVRC